MTGFTKLGLIFGIPVAALLLIPLVVMPGSSKLSGVRPRRRRARKRA